MKVGPARWLALPILLSPVPAAAAPTTPIEHLIVVVGENITFDNLFATYEPPAGETVGNLLSKGIVEKDGAPGPNFAIALQRIAEAREHYSPTPRITGGFAVLPRPGTTYAKGLPSWAVDTRIPGDLPDGPYQITRYALYESQVGDPVHRFFQMWQQFDGGKSDLFTWVATSSGEGSRKRDEPASGTNQGGVAMGFYNMATGDAPYFKSLAQSYAIADKPDGTPSELGPDKYVLTPQVAPNIGTALSARGVSWKWYSGGRTDTGIDKDHLPNPVMSAADPYVPRNRPAIGDLMELFRF